MSVRMCMSENRILPSKPSYISVKLITTFILTQYFVQLLFNLAASCNNDFVR